jgi:hypothetical protein
MILCQALCVLCTYQETGDCQNGRQAAEWDTVLLYCRMPLRVTSIAFELLVEFFCLGPVNDELFCADVGIGSKPTVFRSCLYILGFHKVRGISWLLENLLTSQEGFCGMELVMYFMSLYVCAVCIKLIDKLETAGCVLRVAHPLKRCIDPLDWFLKEPY